MPRSISLGAALLAGLLLLGPWPLLAAGRLKAAPKSAPEEPSIFGPATPPETPSQPASPSPEVCAKIREARKRYKYYLEESSTQSQLDALVAKKALVYTQMGYPPHKVEALMADDYRREAEGHRKVRDAKAAYDRLADDLIGKVETPWPACEASK